MGAIIKIKSAIKAFRGIENRQDIVKTVIRTLRRGGVKELKNAARRATGRYEKAEIVDLFEIQQLEQYHYQDTGIKVLFLILVEQMDSDISSSVQSIDKQLNIDKHIVIVAPKGYVINSKYEVLEYKNNWIKSISCIIDKSEADYVYFLRGGNDLAPNMAGEFFKDISKESYPLIYSDECVLNAGNKEYILKADFSKFDLLYNQNFGQSIAFPRMAIKKVNIFNEEINRLDDLLLNLLLKISNVVNSIKHIDKVLLIHKFDYKETVEWKRVLSVNKEFEISNVDAKAVLHNGGIKIYRGNINEKFSIIIPSDSYLDVCNCIDSIVEDTDYVDFEVIVVSNKEICNKLHERYGENFGLKSCILESGGYSASCNRGAAEATGDILIFLSDDIKIIQQDWLYNIGILFSFPTVGGVSPKIIRNENTIRYAGIIAGGFGFTPIPFNGEVNERKSNWNEPVYITRQVSVLSATCMAVRREIFKKIGGFNETDTPNKFSNVVLSFELEKEGFGCIYCSESTVVAGNKVWYDSWYDQEDPRAYLYLLKKYGEQLSYDPYFTNSMKRQYLRGVPIDFRIYKKKTDKKYKGNILMVSHDALLGGATIALQYAAKALKINGYFVTFLVPEEGGILQELEKDDIYYIVDNSLHGNGEWMRYAGDFDIVFLSTVVMGKYIKELLKFKRKIVWWIHEATEYYTDISIDRIEESDNLFVFCGGIYAQKMFHNYFPHIKTKVLLYGIPDHKELKEINVERENSRILFLSIGTIEKRKGQDILVNAIYMLSDDEREKSKFIFIGKSIQEDVYLKISELHKIYPDNIELLLPIGREKLMEMYDKSVCVVCSSREDPMPVFMTECMMKSRVPICSENTGTAGVLKDGYDGFIYHNNSAEELAEKIKYVIAHINEMKKIGNNARKTYEDNFSMEKFEKNITYEVENILGR